MSNTNQADAAIRVAALRRRLDLTPAELADRLGLLSANTVVQWENGRTRPSPNFWRRVVELEQRLSSGAADAGPSLRDAAPELKRKSPADMEERPVTPE